MIVIDKMILPFYTAAITSNTIGINTTTCKNWYCFYYLLLFIIIIILFFLLFKFLTIIKKILLECWTIISDSIIRDYLQQYQVRWDQVVHFGVDNKFRTSPIPWGTAHINKHIVSERTCPYNDIHNMLQFTGAQVYCCDAEPTFLS